MDGERRARILMVAEYIAATGATVRACARIFGIGKTTIHKDMRQRLPSLNPALSRQVDGVLRRNLTERHIRGGEATRRKHALSPRGTQMPPSGPAPPEWR